MSQRVSESVREDGTEGTDGAGSLALADAPPRNAWFDRPERVVALLFHAAGWVGTPFFANSCVKGRGVSCQKLASAIYRECGWADIAVPEVAMAHARFARVSLVEEWMKGRREFVRVERKDMWPGDLLGFQLGGCVHHVGIYLGGGAFIHTMHGLGTVVSQISDATWGSRLRVVWRPIEMRSEG